MRWIWIRFLIYGAVLTVAALKLLGGDGADAADRYHELRGEIHEDATGDIRLDARNDRINFARIYLRTRCDWGETRYQRWSISDPLLHHHGDTIYGRSFFPERVRNGTAMHIGSLTGTIDDDARRATGTVRVRVEYRDAAGWRAGVCDSGAVSWSATR
jgi:hypothetical protein